MKQILILLFLLSSVISYAQYDFEKNDFFEMGFFAGTFTSTTVEKADVIGERTTIYNDLKVYGANIRYGKGFLPFAHLVFGFNYASREEVLVSVDPMIWSGNIVRRALKSYTLDLGLRFRIIGGEVFEWSIGGGGFARLTPGGATDQSIGYYTQTVVGFNLSQRVQLNAKYGFESSAGQIRTSSLPAEFAFHYKIY